MYNETKSYNETTAGFLNMKAETPTTVTLRSLLSEVEDLSRRLCLQSCVIGDELFGPRPAAEGSDSKDPRGDIRSRVERIRRNLSNANSDMERNLGAIRGEDVKHPNQINQGIG